MKLASFDIFDTTLVRRCGRPENIFYLLSRQLNFHDGRFMEELRHAFFIWRRNAEDKAREMLRKEDITLDEIYSTFDTVSFPDADPVEIMHSEMEMESSNLTANSAIKETIAAKRAAGYTICFISDMYLNSAFLKEILIREGCARQEDKVYVSCETDANKLSGRLYDIVRKDMGYPDIWEHYGDNITSDFRRAANKGIRPVLVESGYSAPEDTFLSFSSGFPFFHESSILAGFQRAARFSRKESVADSNAIDFIAPAYISYVQHIIRKAEETGIKRLYFLARDGYILHRIAATLLHGRKDIELRYLYLSRYSLFLPGIFTLSRQELYENCGYDSNDVYPFARAGMEVRRILFLLRTTPEELGKEYMDKVDFPTISTKEQEDIFFDAIQTPSVREKITGKAEKEREMLLGYLYQEHFLDGTLSGTVDVGWTGTTRLILNRLARHEGKPEHIGFYMGCLDQILPTRYGIYDCYYSVNLTKACHTGMFEHYFSAAPHPTTTGYRFDGKGYVPVLEPEGNSSRVEMIERNISAVCSVAEAIRDYGLLDMPAQIFGFWCGTYLDILTNVRCRIDFSPVASLDSFRDATSSYRLVKRLSVRECLRYLLGKTDREILFPGLSFYYTSGIRPRQDTGKSALSRRLFIIKMKIRYRRKSLGNRLFRRNR